MSATAVNPQRIEASGMIHLFRRTMRLPQDCGGIHVIAGRAWISHCGHDIFLDTGQTAHLSLDTHPPLISNAGQAALSFVLLGPHGQPRKNRIADR